jgi:aminoglycoside N3'-acetyltransferase
MAMPDVNQLESAGVLADALQELGAEMADTLMVLDALASSGLVLASGFDAVEAFQDVLTERPA